MTPDTPTPAEPLKPCPFCGSEPIIQDIEPHAHGLVIAGERMPDHPGSSAIECRCGCGLIDDDRASVIAHWNRRAEIAQPATPEPEVLRRAIQREAERAEEEALVKPLTRDERNAAGAKRHIAWLRAGQPDDSQATQPATHVALTEQPEATRGCSMNYAPLYAFAKANRVSYNELCAAVRAALATKAAFSSSNTSNTLGDASGPRSLSLRSDDRYRDVPTSEASRDL